MSSANLNDVTVRSTVDCCPDTSITTSEAEEDHLLSPLESAPTLGDAPNPPITKPQWNGDPMDWESWPTGRPGPFVPEYRMEEVMSEFESNHEERNKQPPTKKGILHIAEFSSSGRGEFEIYHNSPE